MSYVKVVVLKPFAICVTASGLAYAIPAYEYPCGAPGAAARIYVKSIYSGIAAHVIDASDVAQAAPDSALDVGVERVGAVGECRVNVPVLVEADRHGETLKGPREFRS